MKIYPYIFILNNGIELLVYNWLVLEAGRREEDKENDKRTEVIVRHCDALFSGSLWLNIREPAGRGVDIE